MTSVSAGLITLTPTQQVGSGRPQRESNPGPPHQESRALPTELPHLPRKEQTRLFKVQKSCFLVILKDKQGPVLFFKFKNLATGQGSSCLD